MVEGEDPGQPIGLAYFGQINPSIFKLRGESFDWFLPPARPGSIRSMADVPSPALIGPAKELTPGYYAVSVTLLYGLPWRLYDPAPLRRHPKPGRRPGTHGRKMRSGTSASSSRSRGSGIPFMCIISVRTTWPRRLRSSWPASGSDGKPISTAARSKQWPATHEDLHRSSSRFGPKKTSSSKPARSNRSSRSAPNSVKTG